ncbi:MAG: HAD-IA family hydrolase, partial [Candidatus Omnitrophica bacterium]|nr:HAD-IA family hydrolase [Candidatus Omnitrophota bacterium]
MFDEIITGHDIVNHSELLGRTVAGKPEPDIFMLAALRMGLNPRNCIGFDDSLNGALAIRAAGMACVAIGTEREILVPEADLVIPDLSEINLETIHELAASKASSAGFKGAIFDFDGVVVDTVAEHFQAWKTALEEEFRRYPDKYGRDRVLGSHEFQNSINGRTNDVATRTILVHHPEGELKRVVSRKRVLFKQLVARRDDIRFYSTIRLIKQLRANGIKIALGTASANAVSTLEELGLRSLFDAVVDSSQASGTTKLSIFKVAASQLGLEAQDCVVFEDAKPGVEAAKRAGMRCIGVDRAHLPQILEAADLIVDDLEEVDFKGVENLFGLTLASSTMDSGRVAKFSSSGGPVAPQESIPIVSTFKGAIFDLDGVLINSRPQHFQVWKSLFEAEFRKYPYKYDVNRKFTYREFLNNVYGNEGSATISSILTKHTGEEVARLAEKRRRDFIEAILREDVALYENTIELLRTLKAAGIKIALATSIAEADIILRKLGMDTLFDAVVDSSQVSDSTKRGIFRLAAEMLELRPSECIVFEDSKPGITAAKTAGMLCIGVNRADQPDLLKAADKVLDQLVAVDTEWLRQFFIEKSPTVFTDSVDRRVIEHLAQRVGIDLEAMQRIFHTSLKPGSVSFQEPTTSWESLLYYLLAGRFYFCIDDTFDTHNLSDPRIDPYVDDVPTYLDTDAYYHTEMRRILYGEDHFNLPETEHQNCLPAYVVHVPRSHFGRYATPEAQTEFLAKVLIHEWIEHFMPYYEGPMPEDYIPHNELFAPAEGKLAAIEKAAARGAIGDLYTLVYNYYVFHDPAGTLKKAIFEAIKEIEDRESANFLVRGISSDADLLAWYTYQFEHKSLSIPALSALLYQNRTENSVIRDAVRAVNSRSLSRFRHPVTKQVLLLPPSASLEDAAEFEVVDLLDPREKHRV